MDWVKFGYDVKIARITRGMNQQELADALGVSQAFISKLERGETACSVDFFVKIKEYLGLK